MYVTINTRYFIDNMAKAANVGAGTVEKLLDEAGLTDKKRITFLSLEGEPHIDVAVFKVEKMPEELLHCAIRWMDVTDVVETYEKMTSEK